MKENEEWIHEVQRWGLLLYGKVFCGERFLFEHIQFGNNVFVIPSDDIKIGELKKYEEDLKRKKFDYVIVYKREDFFKFLEDKNKELDILLIAGVQHLIPVTLSKYDKMRNFEMMDSPEGP